MFEAPIKSLHPPLIPRAPLTKSETSDDSSSIGKGIKPLLLAIIVRGATTVYASNARRGWEIGHALRT